MEIREERVINPQNINKKCGQKLDGNAMVGMQNGCLTVISYDGADQIKIKGHSSWEYHITVRCNVCGRIFQTTWKVFRAPSTGRCKNCKACMGKEMSKKQTQKTGFTQKQRLRISAIKFGAKKRNIPYKLSDEQVVDLISKPCVYCGEQISQGIDRIDSMKGYEIDNCVPCCAVCNRMKNNYSLDFFRQHIKQIYKTIYDEY